MWRGNKAMYHTAGPLGKKRLRGTARIYVMFTQDGLRFYATEFVTQLVVILEVFP